MQTVIVVSQAIIVGLIVVGGFWLRYVVNQQVAAKNATIETLHAENERLQRLQGPNLIAEIERVSRFADASQGIVQTLTQELDKLKSAGGARDKAGVTKATIETFFWGLRVGVRVLLASLTRLLEMAKQGVPGNFPSLPIESLVSVLQSIAGTVGSAVDELEHATLQAGGIDHTEVG